MSKYLVQLPTGGAFSQSAVVEAFSELEAVNNAVFEYDIGMTISRSDYNDAIDEEVASGTSRNNAEMMFEESYIELDNGRYVDVEAGFNIEELPENTEVGIVQNNGIIGDGMKRMTDKAKSDLFYDLKEICPKIHNSIYDIIEENYSSGDLRVKVIFDFGTDNLMAVNGRLELLQSVLSDYCGDWDIANGECIALYRIKPECLMINDLNEARTLARIGSKSLKPFGGPIPLALSIAETMLRSRNEKPSKRSTAKKPTGKRPTPKKCSAKKPSPTKKNPVKKKPTTKKPTQKKKV